jgi:hypothetical protein
MVSFALSEALIQDFPVTGEAFGLENRTLVSIEAQPLHTIENRLYVFVSRSFPVCVLDPEYKLPPMAFRVQPAEKRCANAAQVQCSRRAGGEASPDHDNFFLVFSGKLMLN